jgi:hypothetical protein
MKPTFQLKGFSFLSISEESNDLIKKLRQGEFYEITIKQNRNYKLHKKYFALIKLAFDHLTPEQLERIKNIEFFRKEVQILAGWGECYYNLAGELITVSKSIDYSILKELEFEELYKKVMNVILTRVLKYTSIEEVESMLIQFN